MPTESDVLEMALWNRVRLEPREEEVAWLSNGDRIAGGFLAWDERKIKIQVSGKPLGNRTDRDRGGRLRSGPGQLPAAEVRNPGNAKLKDGTRLGVTGATIDDGNVVATALRARRSGFLSASLSAYTCEAQHTISSRKEK